MPGLTSIKKPSENSELQKNDPLQDMKIQQDQKKQDSKPVPLSNEQMISFGLIIAGVVLIAIGILTW